MLKEFYRADVSMEEWGGHQEAEGAVRCGLSGVRARSRFVVCSGGGERLLQLAFYHRSPVPTGSFRGKGKSRGFRLVKRGDTGIWKQKSSI